MSHSASTPSDPSRRADDHAPLDHAPLDHAAADHVAGSPAQPHGIPGERLARGMTAETWDAHYGASERVWSGEPNQALVAEVSGMAPGRALDVGCGEGADAVWLARRGWRVSALDPSEVALGRAQQVAAQEGVAVSWWLGSLEDADLPLEGFDLVSVMYGILWREHDAASRLASLVAPGGTLLVVHHAHVDAERARAHGFDQDLLLTPFQVADALGSGWDVVVHEERDRSVSGGAGAHHTSDQVVRAIRRR